MLGVEGIDHTVGKQCVENPNLRLGIVFSQEIVKSLSPPKLLLGVPDDYWLMMLLLYCSVMYSRCQ